MDWRLFITAFVTLVVIIDPVGNAVVYLVLTSGEDTKHRRRFATTAVIAAAAVIFLFALFGRYILDYLGISLESMMVAGGVLLGIVALDMMKGKLDSGDDLVRGANVALVPLGTPLLAGPGAIVAAILLMNQTVDATGKALVAAGILAALLIAWLALRLAEQLLRVLRETGVDVISRVLGILLAAIAVEFIHQAVENWTA